MKFYINDTNHHLVGMSNSLAGAKRSAIARSKKEPTQIFTVIRVETGKFEAKYKNGQEQFL